MEINVGEILALKKLTEPDRRNESFGITLRFIKQELQKVAISKKVPNKIVTLIDFAKEICLYVYYEYDFFNLSLMYSSLMVETAIKERFLFELPDVCQLKKKKENKRVNKNYNIIYRHLVEHWCIIGFEEIRSLGSILEWLRAHKIIPERFSENDLKAMIDLRNMSAHIASKDIIPPSMVFPMLWRIFDFINCLFDCEEHRDEPEVIRKTRNFFRGISDVINSET